MRTRPNVAAGALTVLWLLIISVPLYAVIVTAFKPQSGYIQDGPISWPSSLTLANLRTVLSGGFLQYIANTLVVTFLTVVIVTVLAIPVGYAIVRGHGWVTSGIFRLFLLGLAIPSQAVVIPLFLLINRLGLYDSLWAVALPTAAFALPVCVLVLTGAMRDISQEMYEAMSIDGAGPVRLLLKLVIPLSRSGIATIAVFTALQAWNGFLFPLIFTQSPSSKLVTTGLYDYIAQYGANVPALMAAVLLSTLPILLVYLFARRALVAGLMGAGGK